MHHALKRIQFLSPSTTTELYLSQTIELLHLLSKSNVTGSNYFKFIIWYMWNLMLWVKPYVVDAPSLKVVQGQAGRSSEQRGLEKGVLVHGRSWNMIFKVPSNPGHSMIL